MTKEDARSMGLAEKRELLKSLVMEKQSGARKDRPGVAPAGRTEEHAEFADSVSLEEFAVELVTAVLASGLKIAPNRIDHRAPLEQYGIESKLVLGMTNDLEKTFGPLSKTLFFEYRNVAEVGRYFLDHHRQTLQALYRAGERVDAKLVPAEAAHEAPLKVRRNGPVSRRPIVQQRSSSSSSVQPAESAIAIVGLSGRYPQAQDLQEYWHNLRSGRDCIEEIPEGRWKREAYSPATAGANGVAGKWGGFIEGVDIFDPLFFNISPHEAQYLDPQERLFLEHVWIAMEDAGYTRESLEKEQVGVYAGVMYSEYQLFGVEQTARGQPIGFASSLASVANRVSYVLNLHGPSVALDTMCSSSLTAIHVACQDLRLGQTSLGIAGGVNVSVHPNKYLALSSGRFLSSRGRCTSFGADGDGYVPGEGVGVVLLKRLADAQRDNDRIYGVIKGSAINHGGKTNGYSVPNPTAQQMAISAALDAAQIDPRAVSYVEAHGTGTKLGDPIEITGLSRAFANAGAAGAADGNAAGCWIGSVKSNIGHCESAAGIAGVTKVLLQMQHGEIVPSLHSRALNPLIDFASTPFEVNQELREWVRPVLKDKDGISRTYPRIAGVSSFGAGGSNAHLLIEEYVPASQPRREEASGPYIVPLSAQTPEQLRAYAQRLSTFVEATLSMHADAAVRLDDLCYTLQVGREAMHERLALIVHSMTDLRDKLSSYLTSPDDVVGMHCGRVADAQALLDITDEGLRSAVATWIAKRRYSKLLEFWVRGLSVDWKELYRNVQVWPKRVKAPTYPFAKERYWVAGLTGAAPLRQQQLDQAIHPLVHRNTSDFFEQRFSSTFCADDLFLADHVVELNGASARILPAVVYLEMARVAMQKASAIAEHETARLRLTDIVWMRPFAVSTQPQELQLGLLCDAEGKITYQFYADREDGQHHPLIYAKGAGELVTLDRPLPQNLSDLKQTVGNLPVSAQQCYQRFRDAGIQYGPAHRAIVELYPGENQVLAKLELPSVVAADRDRYVMHPSLLDAAIQASIGLAWGSGAETGNERSFATPVVPFALDELIVFEPCTVHMWSWVRVQGHSGSGKQANAARVTKLDIDLYDEHGALCVRLRGLASRAMNLRSPQATGSTATTSERLRLTTPRWIARSAGNDTEPEAAPSGCSTRWIVLCEMPQIDPMELQSTLGDAICLTLQSDELDIGARFTAYASGLLESMKHSFRLKNEDGTLADNLRMQVVVPDTVAGELLVGLTGLIKSAQLENSGFQGQLITVGASETRADLAVALNDARGDRRNASVKYERGRRFVRNWHEIAFFPEPLSAPWRHGGVYLITGGLGGIGRLFCEEILRTAADVTVVVTGRSELDTRKQQILSDWSQRGNVRALLYKQVDVANRSDVGALVSEIVDRFGSLHAIVHSAGILSDSMIVRKTPAQLQAVLSPKVAGTVNLDEASKHLTLDFFALFSSTAAVWGGIGQCDYAAANSFMDEYAHYRNRLRVAGQRSGQTLSINWPYWQEGGMRVGAEYAAMMAKTTGLMPLRTESGMQSFYRALLSGETQVLVEVGDLERLERYRANSFVERGSTEYRPPAPKPEHQAVPRDLTTAALVVIKDVLSSVLNLPAERIREEEPFESYGINSIMVMDITNRLEAVFGTLSKTLLYEYHTTSQLAKHFIRYHAQRLQSLVGADQRPFDAAEGAEPTLGRSRAMQSGATLPNRSVTRFASEGLSRHVARHIALSAAGTSDGNVRESLSPDIAIIGLSGRYPLADDLDQYWEALRTGRDCITEVPASRWSWQDTLAAGDDAGSSASRWGGFISGVDEFDPLFFRISPRDAHYMDPQERLFLEHVWIALEDAGYTRAALQAQTGGRVGVYAGVMYSEYHLLALESAAPGSRVAASASYASIANRVSYSLNLAGPSMTVDSMCSSSLTCVHLACQDLKLGRTHLGIAGAVNVSIHPNKYSILATSGFLSSSGRCESFGDGGDGYVPGEGVGVVLLKRLEEAVRDGDPIHGIIRGSALNHGGKTNGYTVPNPNAQQSVIEDALRESGVDARAITYVEAHGTGTKLGDPIEITALSKAFAGAARMAGDGSGGIAQPTGAGAVCWIGSAKSNIGHCEAAAGIAGLTKVLLQMKHGQIAPSLHSRLLNRNLDLAATPFEVNQVLRDWPRPNRLEGEQRVELPRIAGVSSFGAGGSNAHMIVAEYRENLGQPKESCVSRSGPFLIPLSAETAEVLTQYARRLAAHVDRLRQDRAGSDAAEACHLGNLAYTFQVGREAMRARLGIIAVSLQDLSIKLHGVVAGLEQPGAVFRGDVKRDRHGASHSRDVNALIDGKHYAQVLQCWVGGLEVDWHRFYASPDSSQALPRRISLPTYPFAKDLYWIPGSNKHGAARKDDAATLRSTRSVVLTKSWTQRVRAKGETMAGTVIVLHTADGLSLASALFSSNPRVRVVSVVHDESSSPDPLHIDFYSPLQGRQLAQRILKDHAEDSLIGLIDLTACDPGYECSTQLEGGKIVFLQALIEARSDAGLKLLQVTHRLVPFEAAAATTMQGARLHGLYRMLGAEYRSIRSVTMDSDIEETKYRNLAVQIESEFLTGDQERYCEVCYRVGKRYESCLIEAEHPGETVGAMQFGANDVVLVTGGTRGIGAAVAEHVIARGVRRLVVTGREQLPERSEWPAVACDTTRASQAVEKVRRLQSFVDAGVEVQYFNTPLSDGAALARMVEQVHAALGPISGVFHCAGVAGQSPAFYKKPVAEIAAVYEAKVPGLCALHQVLSEEPLEHFVLFSSLSSVVPRLAVGQSDYAAASGFMDCYAAYQAGRGATYVKSIQWPAWADVGMVAGLAPSSAYRRSGFAMLSTVAGLRLLDHVIASAHAVSLPALVVDREFALQQVLRVDAAPAARKSSIARNPAPAGTIASDRPIEHGSERAGAVADWLRSLFVSELRLKPSQVDDDRTFEEYGVESIVVAQLVRTMGDRIGASLDPSVLFEHQTLRELTAYFVANHGRAFAVGDEFTVDKRDPDAKSANTAEAEPVRTDTVARARRDEAQSERDDIAVIGLACRFPGSKNHDAYWELLRNGATAISTHPQSRWTNADGRVDHGGWIDGIHCFDAQFFNIRGDDARVMDPQTRLLLEESLAAIYDAGYDHQQLAGKKIGVYVGARSQSALDLSTISSAANPVLGLAQNYIATSISRFFDFHGPSCVIDTACSSAISSLSFASDALRAGRIDMALVGAVSLLLTADTHKMFRARGILSRSGELRIFDKRSDGEVLGEGGGILIVKRLHDAVRDGNHIYAVVKSTAINNDGRTLGPGSPNIHSQRAVLREAIELSGRRVEDIGYIEVSGSGSPIVDSVELKALTDCYRLSDASLAPCYVGSVKPNIGHLLLSSGLAGFVRCVLSVHHKELPPFLSAHEPFDFYDFAAARIVFNRRNVRWDLAGRPARVAALSSFPDGGTNGHVVIEEFIPEAGYVQRLQPRSPPRLNRKLLSENQDTQHIAGVAGRFDEIAAPDGMSLSEMLRPFRDARPAVNRAEELDGYW